jgi:Ca2+/H+ antiporter, TMEM165/GDT1 family
MESFLVSVSAVAIAEIGDRTQLLALMLAARFRRPWVILSAVLCATLANHVIAGLVGVRLGRFLTPARLDAAVGISMIVMALWTLKPDALKEDSTVPKRASAWVTTFVAMFVAEMGDKTQIATLALAAAYSNLVAVVAGTTTGMMIANIPAVLLGQAFAARLPLKTLHVAAAGLFLVIGLVFLSRALAQS